MVPPVVGKKVTFAVSPDKFVLVSEWSKNQFQNRLGLDVDLDVWEYPIENLRKISKQEAQSKLGLDREYKHVLNVGLFTPGKNQKEIFEIAKSFLNKKVKFHFMRFCLKKLLLK